MAAIVSLDLQKLSDMAGRTTSVGHGFAAGDIPAGSTLAATIGGRETPIQIDVLSTWPDGSIKHGILSFRTPESAEGTATLDLQAVSTVGQAAAIPDIAVLAAEQAYDFTVTVDDVTVDIAALLQDNTPDLWQAGPLVTQGRVTHTLANGIQIRADITVRADGSIDTSITFGNDDIETTGLNAVTYAVAIVQDGETVFENAALTQHHFTVWRERFSTEATPNTAHVVYDMTYLRGTGLLPSVDTGLALADGEAYGAMLDDPDATYDPMQLGGIDNRGGIDEDRGRSGASVSYGVVTDDQHSYLVTQSAEARAGMLELTDQYGAFSDFYRNPQTGEAYLLEDADFNSFRTGSGKDVAGTEGVVDLTNDGPALRNKLSHDPSAFYTAYLVTGDRFFADGLVSEGGSSHLLWASATALTEGGAVDFNDQLRAQAWGLRDVFYSATLAPDASHAKPVLEARLDAALQDYLDYYVEGLTLTNRLGNDFTGSREEAAFSEGPLAGILQSYNGTGIDRPYWQDWFGMVVGQIAATGNEKARALGEWMANFSAGRFLQDDFDATNSLYTLTGSANGSRGFTNGMTWADLQAIAEDAGKAGTDEWGSDGFFTASAWGGTASLFNGTQDVRYAEALLWMTGTLSQDAEALATGNGTTTQFAMPIRFLDDSIAGITDRMVGTDLNDTLADGAGNRLIAVGEGDDAVTTGAGNHLVDGGDGNDSLTGGAGEDWLFGGSGDDRLNGGDGVNILQGDRHDADFGRFADTFAFETTLGDTEVIDFTAGQDVLDFSHIDGLRRPGDVLGAFADTDEGALLDLGAAGRLLLRGTGIAALDEDDIVVLGANGGPVAGADDGGAVLQGNSVTLQVADLLANDTDPDGDTFALTDIGGGAGGTVVLTTDGTVIFTAAEGFTGRASFSYTIRDDLGGEGTGYVSLAITAPPVPETPDIPDIISAAGWLEGTSASNIIIPLDENVRVFGNGADDRIELNGAYTSAMGGAGNDTVVFAGARHNAWGNGGADTFIVATGSTRSHIMDFDVAEDSLVFSDGAGGMTTVADIETAMEQAGADVVIRMTGGSVTLRDVDLADIRSDSLIVHTEARIDAQALTIPETTGPAITGRGWLNGTEDNDMILSGGGNVRLSGGFGDDHMISEHWNVRMQGGAGDDLIESRAHDAMLRGDAGADTFLFRGRVDGVIRDFSTVEDTLAFDAEGTGIANYDDLLAALRSGGDGVEISVSEGDRLTLEGLTQDMLTEDLILFL